MRKSKSYLFSILFILLSGPAIVHGQDTALWRLVPNPSATSPSNPIPIVSGNISAGNIGIGVNGALSTTGGGNGYTAFGLGSKGWVTNSTLSNTGGTDTSAYYEFAVRPRAGYSLMISSIRSTNRLNYTDTSGTRVVIRYSYDSANFNTSYQQPIYFQLTNTDTVKNSWFNLNIPVSSGRTIYLRMYAYKVKANGSFYCKDFYVIGMATPCTSPNASNFSISSVSTPCAGVDSALVNIASSTLSAGNYIITYSLGASNSYSNLTATMSFASGVGSFKIPSSFLTNGGLTQLQIIRVGNSPSCFSTLSSNNTYLFTVLSGPPAAPGPISGQDSLCLNSSGNAFQIASMTNVSGYTWSVPIGWTINAGGGTNAVSVSAGPSAQPGNISVSAMNSCGTGAAAVKYVILKTMPVLISSLSVTRCNDIPATYTAVSNFSGTSFSWSRATVSGISNAAASGSGAAITETLNNTSANPVNVVYVITMLYNGCIRSQNVTVTVYPSPVLNSSLSASVCTGLAFTYNGTSSTPGVAFSWSRSVVSGISNAPSSGSTSQISESLVNTTASPIAVSYVFTLTANGCSNSQMVSVTVNPYPVMTGSTSQTRCSGQSGTYTITSSLNGTSFSWYRDSIGSKTSPDGTGASISELLINNTSGPISVVYVILMNYNGCISSAADTVVVNPITGIVSQPQSVTVCSDSTARFSVLATGASLSYQWQVSTNGGGSFANVSSGLGGTSSFYSLPNITASNNNNQFRVIVNGSCGVVTSNVVSLSVPSVILNNVSGNQSICSNTAPTLFSGSFSGGTGSYSFLWERSSISSSSGFTAAPGTNNQANYSSSLLSSSASNYYFRRRISSGGCAKNSNVIQIAVTPAVSNNSIAANQTICQNAVPTMLNGSSPVGGNGAGSYLFRWERSVSGATLNFDSIAMTQSYSPNALQQSAWFRRVITSGVCKDTSSVISIQVVATNASVTPDTSLICPGQIVALMSKATQPINAQDFSDNARGWSQANAINSGGLTAPNAVNNGSGNSNDWVRYPSGSLFLGNIYRSPDSSDFIMTQSNRPLENTSTILYSPALNTNGLVNLYVKFSMNFRFISAPDAGWVEVSTDNTNWTIIKTYASNIGSFNNFQNEKINLSAYVNLPALYVRFRYFGQYGSWWAMDNLIIEGLLAGFSTNVWSPATSLYTDAAATIPYIAGTAVSVVYARPTVQTTYSVGVSGCFSSNTGTVKVTSTLGTTSVLGSGTYCQSAALTATSGVTGVMYFQGTDREGFSTSDAGSSKIVNASGTYYFRALSTAGCWTSADSAVVVVHQPPSIQVQPSSRSICLGGTDTLRVVTGGTGLNYQWQVSADGGSSWSNLSDNASYSGTTSSALNVLNVSISSIPLSFKVLISSGVACGSPVVSNPVGLKLRNVWTGANSNDWFLASNWSDNNIPSAACTELYITANTPFSPVLTGSASVANITVMNGGLLTLSGGELKVSGSISSNSGIDARDGTIEFNGTGSAQNFYGFMFVNKKIKGLTINNPAGCALTNLIGDTLKLIGQLRFGNVNTTFNTNNNLYLLSDSIGAASVADLTNGGNNTNVISGDVTVETFINMGRKWRFLSIPVSGPQTFRQSWQEGNNVAGGNSRPGYGTIITDNNNAGYLVNGFDFYSPGGPSVKKYNVSSTVYDPIPSVFSSIHTEGGYMAYIRGDRSALPTNGMTSPTILRVKGPLKQGNQNPLSVPSGVFVDIGNPYASSIRMGNIEKTGVQDVFYIWDPRLGGLYGLGAFQTFTNLGGRYYPTPGGGSYADTASFDLIQSGQAFFVRGAAGGTINMRETAKASGFRQVFRGQDPVQLIKITLYEMTGSVPVLADGAAAEFNTNYSNGVDYDDAMKLQASGLNVGLMSNGQLLAVEKRKPVNHGDTLHINLSGAGVRSYRWTISMSHLDTSGRVAFLYDSYLNNSILLDLDGMTSIEFSCDTAVSSRAADRFKIIFRQLIALPLHISDVSAIRGSARNVKISWTVESEEGVDHYEVERSVDGRNFSQNIKSQSPKNSGTTAKYSLTDDDAPPSCLFYRIKMIGQGGQLSYSSIVKVMPHTSATSPDISLYPNPVKDHQVNLIFRQHTAGNYHLSLLGSNGQVIWQTGVGLSEGESQMTLKLPPAILPGVYQLLVNDPKRNNLRVALTIE